MIGIVAVITQANRKPILPVLIVGRTACGVAVAGPATRGRAACRIVAAKTRHTAATGSGSGLPSEFNFSCFRLKSFMAILAGHRYF